MVWVSIYLEPAGAGAISESAIKLEERSVGRKMHFEPGLGTYPDFSIGDRFNLGAGGSGKANWRVAEWMIITPAAFPGGGGFEGGRFFYLLEVV